MIRLVILSVVAVCTALYPTYTRPDVNPDGTPTRYFYLAN